MLLICLPLIYLFIRALYRLYWHPYAKYPGPILGRITSLWAAYHAYKGDIHLRMKICHDKYGDIVRISPDRLLINTNTALATIYRSREVQKSKSYGTWVANNGQWHLANAIDKGIHARKNRHMRQVLQPDKLRAYEESWIRNIDEFIQSLLGDSSTAHTKVWSEPRNFCTYVDRMMMDIMAKVSFGRDLNAQSLKQSDFLPRVIARSAKWNSVNAQSTALSRLHLGELFYPQQIFFKRKSWKEVKDFVNQYISSDSPPTNMFADLINIQQREQDGQLSIDELWVDSTVFINALFDQTGTAFATVIFYLSRNPQSYARLASEIRSKFPDPEEIRSGASIDSCAYLHAVIKESLRMSPPLGGAPWREVISDGLRVDNEIIPRGLDVATSIYSLHHNEAYFPDSYDFKPERWLGEDAKTDFKLAESTWSPFSLGSRSCVAQNMAMMELKDMVARLLWRADFRITTSQSLAKVCGGIEGDTNGRHRPGEFQMDDHLTVSSQLPTAVKKLHPNLSIFEVALSIVDPQGSTNIASLNHDMVSTYTALCSKTQSSSSKIVPQMQE